MKKEALSPSQALQTTRMYLTARKLEPVAQNGPETFRDLFQSSDEEQIWPKIVAAPLRQPLTLEESPAAAADLSTKRSQSKHLPGKDESPLYPRTLSCGKKSVAPLAKANGPQDRHADRCS